uniref:Uncharacterized protein n=1 Tax=Neobodo designis TaxID=312471 RepID=A0A7S1QAK8_NEODS
MLRLTTAAGFRTGSSRLTRSLCGPCAVLSTSSARGFSTDDRTVSEMGVGQRLKELPVIQGQARPTVKEGEWTCPYPLTKSFEFVVRDILEKNGWAKPEIEREMSQIFSLKSSGFVCGSNYNGWRTVEDFQRTPWYQRYRPNEASTTHFVSIECMKLLEENLIPPSQRKDSYAHLRKRFYEDQFFSEKFSEKHARHITREELARQTPGMKESGTMSRKRYLQFSKEYEKRNKSKDRPLLQHEVYRAWRSACGGRNSD